MKEININIIEKGADGDLVVKYPTTTEKQVKGLKESLDKKVDKVEGKQLSTNDYTTEEKNKLAKLANYDDTNIKADIAKKADTSTVNTNLAKKVDKVVGKGLSTNDYGNVEKAEVAKVKDKADRTDLDLKIDKTSITSDLEGIDENKVLSQKAGNFLEDAVKKIDLSGKIDKSSITNSYTGTSVSNVLSQEGANNLLKFLNSKDAQFEFISWAGAMNILKITYELNSKPESIIFLYSSGRGLDFMLRQPMSTKYRPKEDLSQNIIIKKYNNDNTQLGEFTISKNGVLSCSTQISEDDEVSGFLMMYKCQ